MLKPLDVMTSFIIMAGDRNVKNLMNKNIPYVC